MNGESYQTKLPIRSELKRNIGERDTIVSKLHLEPSSILILCEMMKSLSLSSWGSGLASPPPCQPSSTTTSRKTSAISFHNYSKKHCTKLAATVDSFRIATYGFTPDQDKFLSFNWKRRISPSFRCSSGTIHPYEKILKLISTAKSEGATILCGGGRPQHLEKGFFIEPTIITNVDTSMQIWNEEVFGPVLSVKTFRTEEEAIHVANDSQYALGAAVISKDLDRCERMTKAFQAGIVWVNCSQPCFCQAPWGGKKRSGFGRELGEWGLENYLSVKQVTQYISDDPWGWYPAPSRL